MTDPSGADSQTDKPTLSELVRIMRMSKQDALSHLKNQYGGTEGLCVALETHPENGLSGNLEDLQSRRQEYGKNELPTEKPKTFLRLILETLKDFTVVILITSSIVSLVLYIVLLFLLPTPPAGSSGYSTGWVDTVSVLCSVALVVILTAYSEYTKQIRFITLLSQSENERSIFVRRNAAKESLRCQDLVVGDIVELGVGNVVPVDGILLKGFNLKVEESVLTGETHLIAKTPKDDPIIFSGSHVIEGEGKMVSIVVGPHSTLGQIILMGAKDAQLIPDLKTSSATKPDLSADDLSTMTFRRETIKRTSQILIDQYPQRNSGQKRQNARRRKNSWLDALWSRMRSRFVPSGRRRAVDQDEEDSRLTMKLKAYARLLMIFAIIYAAVTVGMLVKHYHKEVQDEINLDSTSSILRELPNLSHLILFALAIIAMAVPEGLNLALTLAVSYSVTKMMEDNNLVRNVQACERMAHTTLIYCDKTGTLTTNKMTAVKLAVGSVVIDLDPSQPLRLVPEMRELLARAIAINSSYSSNIEYRGFVKFLVQSGNRAECALLEMCNSLLGFHYVAFRREMPEEEFIRRLPFNSTNKVMATAVKHVSLGTELHESSDASGMVRVYAKGAAEVILQRCVSILDRLGSKRSLQAPDELVRNVAVPMAAAGLKAIAVAYREISQSTYNMEQRAAGNMGSVEFLLRDLTLIAIVGIEDSIRKEVPDAVKMCLDAGIGVRMITGDSVTTARYVALRCHILAPYDECLIMDGSEFDTLVRGPDGSVEQRRIDVIWPKLKVLARCTPELKYLLVRGVMQNEIRPGQEIVAVTGDGTNDAPALRQANVGFAMGLIGTDVAREAADIILTDDNFMSIIKALLWGRNIFDAVRKFVQFHAIFALVLVNISLIAAVYNGRVPIMGAQMLWINLLMDTLGSLALATEAPSQNILERHPISHDPPLFTAQAWNCVWGHVVYQLGVLYAITVRGSEWFLLLPLDADHVFVESEKATFMYTTFLMMNLFNEINCRRIHGERNVFDNITNCHIFIAIWLIIFLFASHVLWGHVELFRTEELRLDLWAWALFFGIGSLLWHQVVLTLPIIQAKKLNKWFTWVMDMLAGRRTWRGRKLRSHMRAVKERRKMATISAEADAQWMREKFKLLVELEKIRRRREAEWEEEVGRTAALNDFRKIVQSKKPWKRFFSKSQQND